MRADKFKNKKKISNVTNIFEKQRMFKDRFEDYKHDYWIIGRLPNMNVRVDTIFNEKEFYINKSLVIKLYNFLINEKEFLTDKSLQIFCYDLRYFFRYIIEKNNYIDLKEIDYDFVDQYALYLKQNNQSKNKYEKAKKILNKMKKYDFFDLSEDVYDGNLPVHLNFRKAEKAEDKYDEDIFKNIANCLVDIIEDYFKGEAKEETFIKASYWFIAFCTGFNKTAMDNLKKDNFNITYTESTVFYLINGLKNRGKKGFQQSRISVKKGHLFEKVINEVFKINEKLNSKYNSEKQNIFKYEQIKKNTFLKEYKGNAFNDRKIKPYLNKHGLNEIKLSTQKMRNQWSLKMLSISESLNKVSQLLDHENSIVTLSHYLKSRLNKETITKFKVFQELLNQYSKNPNFDSWINFQQALNIDKNDLKNIVKKINEGFYEKATGNCISNEKTNCSNYFNCFNCKNFSVVGDKDLWKIISMREAVIEQKNLKFNWLIETINELLKEFDRESILKARKMLNSKGRHPFWKNQIMVKTIMNNYREAQ